MIINNVSCLHPNGTSVSLDVLVLGRKGSKAPKSYYILYEDKRISPYEQRLRGWSFTLNGWFKLCYTKPITMLMNSNNNLYDLIPKDSSYGSYYVIPIRKGY